MMDKKLLLWIDGIRHFNKALNLVGPHIFDNLEKDVLDCIHLMQNIKEPVLADLGSGSGFPGIPYAVMNPESKVVLIERSQKKYAFLSHIISAAGIENVEALNADPLVTDAGRFPAAISRAFSPKEKLSKATASILEKCGMFYYMGSAEPGLDKRFKPVGGVLSTCKGLNIYSYKFSS